MSLYRLSLISALILLTACAKHYTQDGAPKRHVNADLVPNAVPRPTKMSKYGNPNSYVVFGKRYHVLKNIKHYDKRGIASWYGTKFHGRLTSTREPYNMYAMTAASPVLPIPCYAQVTNLENGRQVIVRVNDRGPFAPNRILDLSYVAAKRLDMIKNGTAMVRVKKINIAEDDVSSVSRHLAYRRSKQITPSKYSELYLQAGAFSSFNNAQILKKRLEQITNEPITIHSSRRSRSRLYRVQVGPLKNIIQYNETIKNLEKHNIKAINATT